MICNLKNQINNIYKLYLRIDYHVEYIKFGHSRDIAYICVTLHYLYVTYHVLYNVEWRDGMRWSRNFLIFPGREVWRLLEFAGGGSEACFW